MRYIEKKRENEPNSLKIHKAQKLPIPNYDNFRGKPDVLAALWAEQNGLCAYCMQSIQKLKTQMQSTKMRIEHFKPEDQYNGSNGMPNLLLAYENYLGVCLGNQNGLKHLYHCDKSKENTVIEICPHDFGMMQKIKFATDGSIFTDYEQYNKEINEILCLNLEHLKKERKAIISALRKILSKEKIVTKSFLQKQISAWQKIEEGKLKPFNQVAIYYLEKRIKSAIL
jgi:uncharacterized protein (TIGR02646 family)